MLIQHYEFTCKANGHPVYQGVTHFGFFSPTALAHQAGLTGENPKHWPIRPAQLEDYPHGPNWPSGQWRMLDQIAVNPTGGSQGLGSAFAVTKVDPQAWFFKAHFYQDPVWPGSLGLEAFIQAAKAVAADTFKLGPELTFWSAPSAGTTHEWLYRGQITPDKGEMTVSLVVTEVNEDKKTLTADGLLMVDGLPIYKMSGFTVGVAVAKKAPSPTVSEEEITPEKLLAWRKEQDLSQGQLAKLMGVTPIYVSLMERGKRNISPLMAEKLNLIFSSSISTTGEVCGPDSEILAKGTLKSRREEKEAATRLLTPEQLKELRGRLRTLLNETDELHIDRTELTKGLL